MSAECSIDAYDGCTLVKHNDYEECILHCSKEKPSKDYHKSFDMLESFYNNLIDYILDELFKVSKETSQINKAIVVKYFNKEQIPNAQSVSSFLKEQKIVFNLIAFPVRNSSESFDYLPILQKLGKIHFNYCKFYLSSLELKSVQCFFQDCEFYDYWSLCDYEVFENVNNVIYQACKFNDNCSFSAHEHEKTKLSNSQFNGCTFDGELSLENVNIEKALFKDWNGFTSKIRLLKLTNCKFEERFILNNYSIEEVYFKDINFKEKFEFKENNTNLFNIINCNFIKLAEFYKSNFIEFEIFKSIFEDYVGFESCSFGDEKDKNNKKLISNFNFVTFLNFINFRNTNFHSGLSFEDTNIKESPNFLNTNIFYDNTSKETYRIIKYSFDKIGNHIEANKFFSLEMKKYKDNLFEKKGLSQEKIVFWFNNFVSNFGQDYVKPMKWLLSVAFIYTLIFYGFKENWIMSFFSKNSYYFVFVDALNTFAKSILPFKKFLPENLEFLTLLFMIIQSTFIWHIVVAIKRHTKR